jgi:hypothetical protein
MLVKKYSKSKCKVTFTVNQNDFTGKEDIRVLGDFNGWDRSKATKLKFSKGKFSGDVELFGGNTYEFRYLADNAQWFNDDSCDGYKASPYDGIENSVLHINSVEPKVTATKTVVATAKKEAATKKEVAPKVVAPKVNPEPAAKKETAPKAKAAPSPKKETIAKAAVAPKKAVAPKAKAVTTTKPAVKSTKK